MQKFTLLLLFSFQLTVTAQKSISNNTFISTSVKRPKLVVGIVIDQMRWDYLYRYLDRYSNNGGFKRMLANGFSCENTMIPYAPTITACGHSSIYTGSVPAITGIAGNDWYDYTKNKFLYCTEDDSAKTIGSDTKLGQMSPRNLLVTTIGDELRLATNFRSMVTGIAIKDRGAILPAGHSANAAFWYDNKTGNWITSSYYMNELPEWAKAVNARKLADSLYALDWDTMYELNTYEQSAPDKRGFPRSLKKYTGSNYAMISATPYGNTLTAEMAKAAINGEGLGMDSVTDMLCVSFSSPDYIGHAFGPNAVEEEDCFLRLDKELGSFLDFLDKKVGKGQYLVFLTADHGAAHAPSFLKEHKIPTGNFNNDKTEKNLDKYLDTIFNTNKLLIGILNYQVYFDREQIAVKNLNKDSVYAKSIEFLLKDSAVDRAFPITALNTTTLNDKIKNILVNGYYPFRSGDIQLILHPQWIDGFLSGGTSHGVWNPYDAHIPLIWYGWNITAGKTYRETYMTDIAVTLAALLSIQMPSGAIGHVIEEVLKK